MAGVLNKTARQFNLKTIAGGIRYVVRLAPGFNVVEDAHWTPFVKDAYVAELVKKGDISFGTKEDDMELEEETSTGTKSKSKADPVPKKPTARK